MSPGKVRPIAGKKRGRRGRLPTRHRTLVRQVDKARDGRDGRGDAAERGERVKATTGVVEHVLGRELFQPAVLVLECPQASETSRPPYFDFQA
jgi:hypothetical protein